MACQNQESIQQPPQFLWESFQRFWGKYETKFVSLTNARKSEQGYVVDYGHSVLLTIYVNKLVVTGAEVTFTDTGQNNEGGQQFLRVMEQLMSVGAFRWKASDISTMRNFFGPMSVVKKELRYKTSHFVRKREGSIWSFRLNFIVNTQQMSANLPLPSVPAPEEWSE